MWPREPRTLVQEVNSHTGKLASSLEAVLKTADQAMKKADSTLGSLGSVVGEDSGVRHELYTALKELSAAARSIRTLADYLERHPEALLHGKGEYGGKPK